MDLSEVSPLTVVECPRCSAPQTVFQNFGPFHLEQLLGTGGMGAVYRARDVALERRIALKILQKTLSHDHSLTAQFEREAELTARINHSHVVRVYSTGSAHGMFYIAMELVDQGSLDGLMEQRGRIPEAELLRIGIQVAEGLQAADGAGLIHRDIKPGNILFAQNGQAKIVDFGLALQANVTQNPAGEIWGTPFYISPEALALEREDFRSDMYALGASLWHALTGAPPHPNSSISMQELLQHKTQPVDLSKVFPEAHPLTAAALNRTLSFEREERFPDYKSFILSLREALNALGAPKPIRVAKWTPEKKPTRKRVGVLGLTIAGILGAWWGAQHLPVPKARPLVEPSFQSDKERLFHAVNLLGQPAQIEVAVRRLELIANSPELTPELHFWTHLSLGFAALLEGNLERAQAALHGAKERAAAAAPELNRFLEPLEVRPPNGSPDTNIDSAVSQPWEGISQLWLGLAAMIHNRFSEAKDNLEKAAQCAAPPSEFAKNWMPFASLLLTQIHHFQTLESELAAALKGDDRNARLQKAEELLQTQHPALFLRVRAGELLTKAKSAPVRVAASAASAAPAASGGAARVATANPPTPVERPTAKVASQPAPTLSAAPPQAAAKASLERLEALREKVRQHTQKFQFKEAQSAAANFSPTHDAERNATAALQRQITAANALFLWAIQEINKGGTLPSPVLRNGSAFKSDPIKADNEHVLVTIAPGTPAIPIVWTDISPLYLIKLVQFRLTTLPTHPQRAELLWGAGHIHLFLGSRQNAKPFLEEAARVNPAYTEAMTTALTGG